MRTGNPNSTLANARQIALDPLLSPRFTKASLSIAGARGSVYQAHDLCTVIMTGCTQMAIFSWVIIIFFMPGAEEVEPLPRAQRDISDMLPGPCIPVLFAPGFPTYRRNNILGLWRP